MSINQKEFQSRDSYEFGVLSQKELSEGKDRTNAKYQRGRDYEARCYSGAVFISNGCRTVQEFFERNPFNLPTNKIYTIFLKKGNGSKEFFGEGNFTPTPVSVTPAYPPQPNAQPANPNTQGNVVVPPPASSVYSGSGYQNYGQQSGLSDNASPVQSAGYPVTPPGQYPTLRKTVDDQDVRITRMRPEIAQKDETIRQLRSQLAEKERQALYVQTQLDAQKEIAELKLNQAKAEHRREIEDLQRQHEGEIKLIEESALVTARTGMADRFDAMEKSNPLNDFLASAMPTLLPVALDAGSRILEEWMERRFPGIGRSAPAPQGQPQSAVPQSAQHAGQQQNGQFVPAAHHYANAAPTPGYGNSAYGNSGYGAQQTTQQQPAQPEPVYHDY